MIIRPFRAVTIDTEGNAEAVEWDTNDTLRPLQQAVGGYVELVSLTATLDMWVNETGLIDGCRSTRSLPGSRSATDSHISPTSGRWSSPAEPTTRATPCR